MEKKLYFPKSSIDSSGMGWEFNSFMEIAGSKREEMNLPAAWNRRE